MKSLTRVSMWVGLALLWPLSGHGQDVYIQYDPSCMDRLEYAYGFTVPGTEYVKYQVQLNATEYLVLEVGPENSGQLQQGFSEPTLQCGEPQLGRQMAENIRLGMVKAFMVRSAGNNRHAVMRINQASYFRRDARGVVYESWQFSFSNTGGLRVGQNLTEDSVQGVNVFFQGPTQYQCADAYLFKQTFQFASPDAYREIVFVPGIGIVEERPANGDPHNVYQLKRVNGQAFDEYLQARCREGIAASTDFLNTQQKGAGTPQAYAPANTAPAATPAPPPAPAPTTHTVERGETLFALSRKYGVSVSEIQAWNQLGSSTTISVGQVLTVSDPNAQPRMATAYTYKSPGEPAAWHTTTGTHRVRAGETVPALATLYGYTEARFRDMNNLAPNQTISEGMLLKTAAQPGGQTAYANPNTSASGAPARGGSSARPFMPPANSVPTDPNTSSASLPTGQTASSGNNASLPTGNTADSNANAGNIQPFVPPTSQGTNPPGGQNNADPNAPSAIQPFSPPGTTTSSGGNQRPSTPNTLPGNPSTQNNAAGIQPFTPPGNPATRGGNQPITPYTLPTDPQGASQGNSTTSPVPSPKKPSSSFGIPVPVDTSRNRNNNAFRLPGNPQETTTATSDV